MDMAARGALWGPTLGQHTSSAASALEAGRELQALADEINPVLLIIDPLSAAYLGNENDRSLVRMFMSHWDVWARERKRAVMIIAHKSKADDGEGRPSGSTDWEAAARAVWSLDNVKMGDKPSKGPDSRRSKTRLGVTKSNYARLPDPLHITLRGQGEIRWEVLEPWEVAVNGGHDDKE